jgi:hypothetical protein
MYDLDELSDVAIRLQDYSAAHLQTAGVDQEQAKMEIIRRELALTERDLQLHRNRYMELHGEGALREAEAEIAAIAHTLRQIDTALVLARSRRDPA